MFKCLNTLAGRQGCAQLSDQIDDMMCPLTWVTATVDTKVRTMCPRWHLHSISTHISILDRLFQPFGPHVFL